MREADADEITKIVAKLYMDASCFLNEDIKCAFKGRLTKEVKPMVRDILNILVENMEIAK